ncbi:hypothetical protein [Nostocoides vanveenii]|uniref:DNA-binding protein n=1 Tax=Nostocoides vanveenii TaxID=330835 RepID=A0ABP4WBK6_9MICO
MLTEVCLQVEGLNLDDEQTSTVIEQRFADYLWGSVDGLVTVTIYVDSDDVPGDVVEAARAVEHYLPGVNVRRVHRDLVTASDIAGRVGVSREAVRKWTQRDGDAAFPAPYDTVGGDGRPSKVWLWSDVLPWLKNVYGIDMDENLPDDATVAHIDACLAKVTSYLDRQWRTVTATAWDSDVLSAVEARLHRLLVTHWSQAVASRDHGVEVVLHPITVRTPRLRVLQGGVLERESA